MLRTILLLVLLSVITIGSREVRADIADGFFATGASSEKANVQIYADNNESWYLRWKVLSEARSSIDVAMFAVHPDVFGKSFLGLLLKKAEQGVKVRLLVDSKGSEFFAAAGKGYLKVLAEHPNVAVRLHNPMWRTLIQAIGNPKYLFASLHQKLLVIDRHLVVTGGRNIGAAYYGDPAVQPETWRDTDVVVDSENAAAEYEKALDAEFRQKSNRQVTPDWTTNWARQAEELIFAVEAMERWISGDGPMPESEETRKWKARPASEKLREKMEGRLQADQEGPRPQPVASDMFNKDLTEYPTLTSYRKFAFECEPYEIDTKLFSKGSFVSTSENAITRNLVQLIDSSEREIVIQNPYVVLTSTMFEALKKAHDRGVQIVFHTNSPISTDSLFTQAFFVEDWVSVRKAMPNAQFFTYYRKRKLHSKVFVFDRRVTVVGTYNMDYMSESINSELITVLLSPEISEKVFRLIEKDIEDSMDLTGKGAASGSVNSTPSGERTPDSMAPLWLRIFLKVVSKIWFLRNVI